MWNCSKALCLFIDKMLRRVLPTGYAGQQIHAGVSPAETAFLEDGVADYVRHYLAGEDPYLEMC